MADLRIETYRPIQPDAWVSLRITHEPTGHRLDSVHLSRNQLIHLLGLIPAVQAHYAEDRSPHRPLS